MLVLSRKTREEVVITIRNERIVITVVELRGDKVRLGFDAHESVKINRSEVQTRIDSKEKDHVE